MGRLLLRADMAMLCRSATSQAASKKKKTQTLTGGKAFCSKPELLLSGFQSGVRQPHRGPRGGFVCVRSK